MVTQLPAQRRRCRPRTRSGGLHRLLLGAAAVGCAICASAVGGSLVSLAANSPSYQVLVADGSSGNIYVTDPSAQTVTTVAPPVSGGIQALATSPDGSRVYVAFKNGSLGTLDTSTDSYLGVPVVLGWSSAAVQMVVTPNGQDLYIAESGSNQVVEVNTLNDSMVGSPIATGPALNLAISLDGSSLFVDGGSQSNSVSVITTATNTLTANAISVATPGPIVKSPDGTSLYVVSSISSGPAVVVIDSTTDTVEGSPIPLPSTSQPAALALSADGSELYVTDASGQQVEIIGTAALGSSVAAMPQGLTPRDIAITPDGATAYIDGTNLAGTSELVSADLASGTVGAPVILVGGTDPAGLVIAPLPATGTPTPSPTPTPTPACIPIGVGPVPLVSPVTNSSSEPGSTGSSDSSPAATPSTSPTAGPSSTTLPPLPITSPSPEVSPGSSPSPDGCSVCTPIESGLVQGGPAQLVSPGSEPPAAAGSSGSSPAGTPSTNPAAGPPKAERLPLPVISPSPEVSPGVSSPPFICFGAALSPGVFRAEASLTSGTAAAPSGSLYLRAALVILTLAGAAAVVVWRFGLRLPRLRNWRIG